MSYYELSEQFVSVMVIFRGSKWMDNYVEYLEKLQSKMDFRKSVDDKKVKFYFDMKNVNQRLSNLFISALVSLELLLCVIGVTTDIVYRNIIVGVMVAVLLFFGFTALLYAGNAASYENLACYERDKIYFANYDIIKNEVVNDDDEQIRQLILWKNMYELAPTDEVRYRELLRIVKSVYEEYSEIYK